MGVVLAIGLNTFREAVRDKVLYSMLLFAVGIILFSLVLGRLAPGEQLRLTIDVGLSGISLMTVLLAIVIGVSHLYKEIERKTVYFILPMPLARWQFLAGKFLGMAWIMGVTLGVMTGTLLTVMAWHEEDVQSRVLAMAVADLALVVFLATVMRKRPHSWPSIFAVWMLATGAWLVHAAGREADLILQGATLIFFESLVITSIALLFSSFSTPFLSGVLTFLIFVAGRELRWLDELAGRLDSPFLRGLTEAMGAIFPNCYLFAPSVNVLEGRFLVTEFPMAPWVLVGNAASYGMVYTALVLGIAGIILWRRDFV